MADRRRAQGTASLQQIPELGPQQVRLGSEPGGQHVRVMEHGSLPAELGFRGAQLRFRGLEGVVGLLSGCLPP